MLRLLQPPPPTLYRPRRPLESHFHQLIRRHFQRFRALYPHRYAPRYGYWRPIIDKAIRKFLTCGDLQHGFARIRCPGCHHQFLVPFSCKQRCICPSCSQKRTLLFGLHVANDIARPIPHRQFVWTIPKRLRIFFRFHRPLLQRLPPLAWQTITETYRALLGPDALPGGILAIQTFGALIHFHPHLHGLITDGAFLPDGSFQHLPANLTHEPFLRLWEHKIFQLLLEEGLIDTALIDKLRSRKHSGFHVDRSVFLPAGDSNALNRLAQYMARCPFSLARIIRITPEGKILYKADKDRCQHYPQPADLFGEGGGTARNFQLFDPLDFLAELTQHIPNKGEHPIRYYGCYSNKSRRVTPASCPPVPQASCPHVSPPLVTPSPPHPVTPSSCHPAPAPNARRRWAILLQLIHQTDPLLCPRCGSAMKIIAFIEARQTEVIRKILQHCNLWHDPPPPIPWERQSPDWPIVPPPRPSSLEPQDSFTREVDPDFLEHRRREDQLDLPWE